MKPNLQLEYESQAASSVIQIFSRILREERENEYSNDHEEEDSPTKKAIIIIIAVCIGLGVLGVLSCLIKYCYTRYQERNRAQVRHRSETAYEQQNVQLESLGLQQTQELASCPICLMPIPTSLMIMTPCHHQFHKACLDLWLLNEKICPSCRTSLNL